MNYIPIPIKIDEDIDKLIQRVRPFNIEFLYRYRTIDSLEIDNIFKKQKIFMPNPVSFNDPFDCKPKIGFNGIYKQKKKFLIDLFKANNPALTKKEIKRLMREKSIIRKFNRQEVINKMFNDYQKLFGIYCLSEIPDNLLMWSHYSDKHRGFCLQFKSDDPESFFGKAFKIKYQSHYPYVNLRKIYYIKSFFDTFTTKSTNWEYEQEWRIIKTPYDGGPGWYSFEPELLTGIIIGARATNSCKKKIESLVREYPTKIELYEAKLNEREYKIDIGI